MIEPRHILTLLLIGLLSFNSASFGQNRSMYSLIATFLCAFALAALAL